MKILVVITSCVVELSEKFVGETKKVKPDYKILFDEYLFS